MSVAYVDPMLPRLNDGQLEKLINEASGLLTYRRKRVTGRDIVAEIAEIYQLSASDLTGPGRCRSLAHPRHHAMWEIRQRTTLSLPQIGRIFNRDHTTVLYAVRAHEARLAAERAEVAA